MGERSGETTLGRARLSCLPCRKRKSKCDEKIPCSSCLIRNTRDICQLPDTTSKSSLSSSSHTSLKKRRLSYDEPVDTLTSTSQDDIDSIRKSLARLEEKIKMQNSQAEIGWAHETLSSAEKQLPDRLDDLDEVLAILPSQADCETLFEYILQEADWMVNSIGVQWLEPIWSRFIYGARVTKAESMLLVAVLAVAALLLEEGPHIYYQTASPLGPLQSRLTDHMFQYIESLDTSIKASSHRDSINEFLVLAMAFDYLRLSGSRMPGNWLLVRKTLYQMERRTPFLSNSDLFWQNLDETEIEYARRAVWHFVICERWGDLYENQSQSASSPFRRADIEIPHPRWICSSLCAPFRARPMSNASDKITMAASPKSVTRIFRLKDEEEAGEVPLLAQLLTELSLHVSAASKYISAIDSWRKSRHKPSGSHIDHQKEALLHQSVVICNNIKEWQHRIRPYCAEPEHLDPNDYRACRRASQAAIIHVGRRQILSAVLGAWVTEESIMEEGSPLLAQQQREAFKNARDAVKTIDVTRALLSCGKILQIPWATLAFFTAATTLAIPLLAASRLQQRSSSTSREDFPRVFRVDHLVEIDSMTTKRPILASVPFYPSNDGASSSILSMDEMRTLAPDILRILELMPHYRPTFLSIEARQRLVKLVETYGGNATVSQEQPVQGIDGGVITPDLEYNHSVSETTTESNGYSVLDSLIALDDFWWDQLLSSNDQGTMPNSSMM